MKKCQTCGKAATVHITKIVNGQKQEMHLCQECSEKQQVLKNQELNLAVILQTMIGQHVGGSTDELARLTCPTCGIKYMEFKAEGRLGCPVCGRTFAVRDGVVDFGGAPRHEDASTALSADATATLAGVSGRSRPS